MESPTPSDLKATPIDSTLQTWALELHSYLMRPSSGRVQKSSNSVAQGRLIQDPLCHHGRSGSRRSSNNNSNNNSTSNNNNSNNNNNNNNIIITITIITITVITIIIRRRIIIVIIVTTITVAAKCGRMLAA